MIPTWAWVVIGCLSVSTIGFMGWAIYLYRREPELPTVDMCLKNYKDLMYGSACYKDDPGSCVNLDTAEANALRGKFAAWLNNAENPKKIGGGAVATSDNICPEATRLGKDACIVPWIEASGGEVKAQQNGGIPLCKWVPGDRNHRCTRTKAVAAAEATHAEATADVST